MNNIEKRFGNIWEVKPDAVDLQAIERIEQADDVSEGITLDEMDKRRAKQKYSGKISLKSTKNSPS